MLRGSRTALLAALCCLLAFPASAAAAKRWIVKGAGFGHGVGMSQYGAYGFAKHGFPYDQILAHYYTGTTLGTTQANTIRVLLRPYARSVSFSGAGSACGTGLKAGKTYVAKSKTGGVVLRTKKGRLVAKCGALMSAAGAPILNVIGKGTYRGALEVRSSSVPGTVNAINAVDLEDYIRGVVSRESPASWPIEALEAQAVAARSYALSTAVRGNGFDVYDDTRSQVYGGVGAETAKTDQAVSATHLRVVLYRGRVAQTYFFSTSGGHTENNEFSSLGFGQPPIPYLRGVDDPYEADAGSPYEHWKRKFTRGRMNSALSGLVRGKLKNIVVTERGASPRIVHANLIGSGGTTTVTGPQLRDALGLPDTWAFFKKK
jgi:stage II sporulation protein D